MTPLTIAEHISNLERLLLIEERFNKRKPLPSTATTWMAAQLVEAMGKTVGAMVRYLCGRMDGPPQTMGLDPSVAAVLARVLIEQAETFQYLCLGQISQEEREFRHGLYYLHQRKEVEKIEPHLPSFKSPGEDFFREISKKMGETSLEENSIFQAQSAKMKAQLLSGNFAFFNLASGGHGRRIPRNPEIASLYKLFSNVIHGTSLGLHASRTSSERLRLDGYNLMSLSMCCAVRLFAICLDEYSKMRPRIRAQLKNLERKWIEAIRGYPLEMWPRDREPDESFPF